MKYGSYTHRVGWLAAGIAVAAAAGCSASAPSSSSVPPAPSSATSSAAGPTTSASATVPGSATPSAPSARAASPTGTGGGGGASACASRDLRAEAGTTQGAAGSIYQVIVFTNLGSVSCTLFGYPGVSLASGTPVTQVGAAADRSTANTPALVTLPAGGHANALLRITQAENYPAAKCQPTATTYLQIFPPNQTTPLYLPYKSTGCTLDAVHLLAIGAVRAGTGG